MHLTPAHPSFFAVRTNASPSTKSPEYPSAPHYSAKVRPICLSPFVLRSARQPALHPHLLEHRADATADKVVTRRGVRVTCPNCRAIQPASIRRSIAEVSAPAPVFVCYNSSRWPGIPWPELRTERGDGDQNRVANMRGPAWFDYQWLGIGIEHRV
jgi:hypothetical protein